MPNNESQFVNYEDELLIKYYDELLQEYEREAVKGKVIEGGDTDLLCVDICYELQICGMDEGDAIVEEKLTLRLEKV
ncbi:MAG: hypothetical protein FWG43_04960 [Clostridiales bacterium]|nr:hypothetical protein [Clostridiales bacterium]